MKFCMEHQENITYILCNVYEKFKVRHANILVVILMACLLENGRGRRPPHGHKKVWCLKLQPKSWPTE